MVSDRKLVGKSVRACDNCARKRGRWYCGADDAFLCEPCDSSVHTANPLARRHERVRLKIASDDESEADEGLKVCAASSWHEGFTRKARTPRRKKHGKLSNPLRVVPEPEVCSEEESEEQLLYRVPVFEVAAKTGVESHESKADEASMDHFFLPSELDLADFAADVESLLGKGLDEESLFGMKGLGILECDDVIQERKWRIVKDEDQISDVGREIFELNFDDEEENKTQNHELISRSECKVDDSNKALLKLDYERVISAWDDSKSPWTTGEKPEYFSSGAWLPDCCLVYVILISIFLSIYILDSACLIESFFTIIWYFSFKQIYIWFQ